MNSPAIGTPNAKLLQANSPMRTSALPPFAAKRRSYQTKSPNAGKAAAKHAMIHSGQPSSRPSSSGTMRSSNAVVMSATPPQSRPTTSVCSSLGRMKIAAMIVPSASGTLTRKIGRHSRRQRSSARILPPRICPATAAMPITEPKIPSAFARSLPEKFTWMMASTCGYISAPPMPWTARAPIRISLVGASPQPAEAAANTTRPRMKRSLRP